VSDKQANAWVVKQGGVKGWQGVASMAATYCWKAG